MNEMNFKVMMAMDEMREKKFDLDSFSDQNYFENLFEKLLKNLPLTYKKTIEKVFLFTDILTLTLNPIGDGSSFRRCQKHRRLGSLTFGQWS